MPWWHATGLWHFDNWGNIEQKKENVYTYKSNIDGPLFIRIDLSCHIFFIYNSIQFIQNQLLTHEAAMEVDLRKTTQIKHEDNTADDDHHESEPEVSLYENHQT